MCAGEVQHRREAEAGAGPGAVDTDRVQAPPGRYAGYVHVQVTLFSVVAVRVILLVHLLYILP